VRNLPEGLAASQPIVELLAEALGVDLGESRARDAATAWRDYLSLKLLKAQDAADERAVVALDVILQDLDTPRDHATTHSALTSDPKMTPAVAVELLRGYSLPELSDDSDVKRNRATLLEYLDEETRRRPSIARVEAAAHTQGIELDTLIAMLPDYVDSQTRRLFDSGLAGVQEGANAMGYSLDRFYLPDWSALEPDADATKHETQPGALLFRLANTEPQRMLLVLIVTEMPTSGVHRRALLAAISMIDAWHAATVNRTGQTQSPAERSCLRILGPFFSGSVTSLMQALRSINENTPQPLPRTVKIVSGSATAPDNGQRLRSVSLGKPVEFSSFAPDNALISQALYEYLVRLNPAWKYGDGVAIFSEANTVFGQSLKLGQGGRKSIAPTTWFDHPLRVTFPLHISRLRGAVSVEAPLRSLLPAPAIRLTLGESAQPKDLTPSFTPEMTAAVVESALDNILSTLKRGHYSAVGIFATDARDHLFLAREIARVVPNVLMFGTQSDLLYINQDFAPFLKGTVIASSYPLFNETQLFTEKDGAQARHQFTTSSEQGIYNATALFLSDLPGVTATSSQLVDANAPPATCFKNDCPSPVWVSVVGSRAIWPISRARAESNAQSGAYLPEASSTPQLAARVAPTWAVLCQTALFVIAIVHFVALFLARKDERLLLEREAHSRLGRIVDEARDVCVTVGKTIHWSRSRIIWNFYPPSRIRHEKTFLRFYRDMNLERRHEDQG